MAWHTVAWYQSVDTGGVLTELDTVVDDVLTRSGAKRFLVPQDYRYLRFAFATGVNLTDARLSTPSMLVRRMHGYIVPHRRGARTLGLDAMEVAIYDPPIALTATEEISALANEDAAGADALTVVASLGPETLPLAPRGDVRIVRLLGTTALTANVWTTVSVTPEFSLEPGTYVLAGFLPISAGCIAARAILVGQQYRPGFPGLAGSEAAALDVDMANLRPLLGYNLGTFTHITIPQFQFLSASADTSEVVYAFVVKVG